MFYVVLEYLTAMYGGIFNNLEDAIEQAKEIGGFIVEYNLTSPLIVDEYGEIQETATIESYDEDDEDENEEYGEIIFFNNEKFIRYPLDWE